MESIVEGWVKFSRQKCVEGFIDVWYGDCADNPNNERKSHWNLNGFATYIRLDGGEWFPTRFRGIKGFTIEMSEVSTSKEIWAEIYKE